MLPWKKGWRWLYEGCSVAKCRVEAVLLVQYLLMHLDGHRVDRMGEAECWAAIGQEISGHAELNDFNMEIHTRRN